MRAHTARGGDGGARTATIIRMSPDDLRPDEVLALRYDEAATADELAAWCGGSVERVALEDGSIVTTVWAPTDKGPRPAVLGDWVVRTAEGGVQVMDATAFAARHAPAVPPAAP